ncbi:MAG: hypothetical protein ACHP7N_14890 [Caulobacterales bacterium]
MNRLALTAAVLLMGLGACTQQPATPAAPPQTFEAISLAGAEGDASGNGGADEFIKINTTTGAAWVHCCSVGNTVFGAVKDGVAPPAGDYHLLGWSTRVANGSIAWAVYRFDRKTGHTWTLQGDPSSGYHWNDDATVE